MALEMEESLANGFDVSYWKVHGEIRIDYDQKMIRYVLYGYKSKKQRELAPDVPGTTRDIVMRDAEFEKHFPRDSKVNLLTACYAAAQVVEDDPHFREAENA